MIIELNKLSKREEAIYADGYIHGMCHHCKKRTLFDDYDKIPSCKEYCNSCKNKKIYTIYDHKISITR